MTFDWRDPDYSSITAQRIARLAAPSLDARSARGTQAAHYREHPADFIADWGMTHDPRNVERGPAERRCRSCCGRSSASLWSG